jgi:metal-sulfur cluster biosynthetic enzyme
LFQNNERRRPVRIMAVLELRCFMQQQTQAPAAATDPASLDPDVLGALVDVVDPEVGIGIVELGLVYRATRDADGIAVDMTLTTQACPLGEMIADEARLALKRRFPDAASITVQLVHTPAWTPDRISDRARSLLGY